MPSPEIKDSKVIVYLNRLSDLPKLKEVSEILEEQPALTEQIDAFK